MKKIQKSKIQTKAKKIKRFEFESYVIRELLPSRLLYNY